MRTLAIRNSESIHERLRNLARARGMSVNRPIEELATVALTVHDGEMRFRAMAARGSKAAGLALLDRLDLACRKN